MQSSRLGDIVSNEEHGNLESEVDIEWQNAGKSRDQQKKFSRGS